MSLLFKHNLTQPNTTQHNMSTPLTNPCVITKAQLQQAPTHKSRFAILERVKAMSVNVLAAAEENYCTNYKWYPFEADHNENPYCAEYDYASNPTRDEAIAEYENRKTMYLEAVRAIFPDCVVDWGCGWGYTKICEEYIKIDWS